MGAVLKIIAALPAIGFIVVGLSWWIAPEFAGTLLGMELLGGAGLSTQLADLSAFFLMLGCTILIGLLSDNRVWLYPPIILLGFAVVGRLIAWLFHGADPSIDMIAAEAVVIAVLLLNVRRVAKREA